MNRIVDLITNCESSPNNHLVGDPRAVRTPAGLQLRACFGWGKIDGHRSVKSGDDVLTGDASHRHDVRRDRLFLEFLAARRNC